MYLPNLKTKIFIRRGSFFSDTGKNKRLFSTTTCLLLSGNSNDSNNQEENSNNQPNSNANEDLTNNNQSQQNSPNWLSFSPSDDGYEADSDPSTSEDEDYIITEMPPKDMTHEELKLALRVTTDYVRHPSPSVENEEETTNIREGWANRKRELNNEWEDRINTGQIADQPAASPCPSNCDCQSKSENPVEESTSKTGESEYRGSSSRLAQAGSSEISSSNKKRKIEEEEDITQSIKKLKIDDDNSDELLSSNKKRKHEDEDNSLSNKKSKKNDDDDDNNNSGGGGSPSGSGGSGSGGSGSGGSGLGGGSPSGSGSGGDNFRENKEGGEDISYGANKQFVFIILGDLIGQIAEFIQLASI